MNLATIELLAAPMNVFPTHYVDALNEVRKPLGASGIGAMIHSAMISAAWDRKTELARALEVLHGYVKAINSDVNGS